MRVTAAALASRKFHSSGPRHSVRSFGKNEILSTLRGKWTVSFIFKSHFFCQVYYDGGYHIFILEGLFCPKYKIKDYE
jgi:hypothetical protein